MAKGILIAAFDFSGAHADEFHDWYDLEHIPERQIIRGFGATQRWIGHENEAYSVATYDLDSVDVLLSDPYCAIAYGNSSVWTKRVTGMCTRLLRFVGTQITPGDMEAPEAAGALLLNAMNVAPKKDADFNAWYDEEHLPSLSGVPGVLAARRYRARDDDPDRTHRYVAIYHLNSPDVTGTKSWAKAANTSWSARLRPHFKDRIRILTHRYAPDG